MFGNLKVSFNSPQCGWMSVGFADEQGEFNTTTASLPYKNALSEILASLVMLLRTPDFEHVVPWNRDPEEFDFVFERAANITKFSVIEYPTPERKNAVRVFEHIGDPMQIAIAFEDTFRQLYEERKVDEFLENWQHAFPFEEYELLRKAIESQTK